jgi:hypothetical protein
MKSWINFIAFQLVWFAAVAGASYDNGWIGPIAVLPFAIYQLRPGFKVRGDTRLMLVAIVVGFATDSLMAGTGLAQYAAAMPSAHFAPLWIVSLWAGFALTLNHSMRWLARRPFMAALLGATLGPVSYLAAGRVWGVVTFTEPLSVALCVLGACWLIAMLVLCHALRHFRRRPSHAIPMPLMRAP